MLTYFQVHDKRILWVIDSLLTATSLASIHNPSEDDRVTTTIITGRSTSTYS